jgi:ABC-type sulfate/molybdate transport systems ATPase subunit
MSALSIHLMLQREDFELKVDLEVPRHGVTAIVGPSGSGKSTLLRLIAGLERPHRGSIYAGARSGTSAWVDVENRTCLPAQQRKVGVVFQDYTLFEHMTVAQNIAYGVAKTERNTVVPHWIERLHLNGLEQRYPVQLSGGQRQRVALARALAPQPELLLLDEPFSAVDAHLRQALRSEIKQLIRDLEQPVLIITHDLEDVRQMANYIGVMVDGEIRRFAPTAEAFDQPHSHEVAQVLGWQNFLYVRTIDQGKVTGDWGELALSDEAPVDSYCVAIRPEHIKLVPASEPGITATVTQITEVGPLREVECRFAGDGSITLLRPWNEPLPVAGSEVRLQLPEQHLRILPRRKTLKAGSDEVKSVVTGVTDSATAGKQYNA